MKRLTDAEKFQKDFYRSLPSPYKLLWEYLCCECNTIGLWRVEEDVAKIRLGKDVRVDFAQALHLFNKDKVRVVPVNNGKQWFLVEFIEFQYGKITSKHTMYKKIMQEMKAAGLEGFIKVENDNNNRVIIGVSEGYDSPMMGDKDIYIDIDKDKDIDISTPKELSNREIAERVIELYKTICPTLPKPMVTEKRITHTHLRLEAMSQREIVERATAVDPSITDGWGVLTMVLKKVNESEFLKGNNDRGWTCNYDWLFCEKNNWVKVFEGAYSGRAENGSLSVGQVIHSNENYNF